MSQHKKNISVKCKILLKNILSFLDKIFKIYVETTHCKCGVFLPKWDNKQQLPLQNLEQNLQFEQKLSDAPQVVDNTRASTDNPMTTALPLSTTLQKVVQKVHRNIRHQYHQIALIIQLCQL
ncbi:hypothetical protein [Candidatus Tisiphia endosymbiont of Parasteatoda lunata]|uniref:hypothetical protein n=1 Tax=Candidatus Tisiphia endosymbiont of Parasteatoda lunata TaxID=3066275 RepID=UPI00313C0F00